jgi:sRNA-binding carbon storage regulator CsrA
MTRIQIKVDHWLSIGRDIRLTATDVDDRGVRLIARGRVLGGHSDGQPFDSIHEMAVGNSINLGPHVAVTLVSVRGETATLGIFAPPNLVIA